MRQRVFQKCDDVLRGFSIVFASLSALLIFAIVALMLFDISQRIGFSQSTDGIFETIEKLLVFSVFLALPVAERAGTNVRVTFFLRRLPSTAARGLRLTGTALAIWIVAWLAYATGVQALDSFSIREAEMGVVNMPIWPAKIAIFVGFAALFLEMTSTLIRQLFPDRSTVVREVIPKQGEESLS